MGPDRDGLLLSPRKREWSYRLVIEGFRITFLVDGKAAHGVMHERKAASARGTASERSRASRINRAHRDGGPDESIDGGIISENAEECLITTTAWLGRTLLEGVESGEPVGWWGDD